MYAKCVRPFVLADLYGTGERNAQTEIARIVVRACSLFPPAPSPTCSISVPLLASILFHLIVLHEIRKPDSGPNSSAAASADVSFRFGDDALGVNEGYGNNFQTK